MTGLGASEYFPVFITEEKVIGDHVALFLDTGTVRPDIKTDQHIYSVRSLANAEGWLRVAEFQSRGVSPALRESQIGFV